MTTADKIRQAARQYATYTDAAAAGMQPQQLADYMSGRKSPGADVLRRMADAWGVKVDDLVGD